MQFQKISIPTPQGLLEILRGWGVSKAKIFKAKYGAYLEFPEEWGDSNQKPSVGGVWIFSRTTHSDSELNFFLSKKIFP